MRTPIPNRKWPIGAEVQPGGGTHFRLWAPDHREVAVEVDGVRHPLEAEPGGYFSGLVADVVAGAAYGFRLGRDQRLYPDPASRWQPEGPHGPSRVVDPAAFQWTDADWSGVDLFGQVLYELHIGTFTPEGTWAAAAEKLPKLKDIGVTLLEMMPVAEFSGRFGWGYDGVDLFAPTRLYGEPDDLRRFIDAAHGLGIGVILDVVYNHLGPDGNFLPCFAKAYFSSRYKNEWGDPLNFDDAGSEGVREFFITNAAYWVDEFHFDGLRLDATQQIFDASADHLVAAVTRAVRAAAAGRKTVVVGENEPQDTILLRAPERGGYGLDGLWNDDFHHSAIVAATGHNEAYYSDYAGTVQELVSAAKHGFLMQGQRSAWQDKPRGSPAFGIAPKSFVTFVENHDQVANSGTGKRLHQLTSPGVLRAITALILLGPGTPMLFQGQEFASSRPFQYFADHTGELGEAVANGRRAFVLQFESLEQVDLPDPRSEATFRRCVLDWSEWERHAWAVALHRDLLGLRRRDPVFARQAPVDGAVIGERCLVLRFSGEGEDARLLLVNLGTDLTARVIAEPLLAPPAGRDWAVLWSSEAAAYGGNGTRPLRLEKGWHVQGCASLVLAPIEVDPVHTGEE